MGVSLIAADLTQAAKDINSRFGQTLLNDVDIKDVVSPYDVEQLANELIDEIISEAKTTFNKSAKTVLGNVSSLESGSAVYTKNSITIPITMSSGNLYRPSVAPDRFGGIDNIVKLFITGYQTLNQIYGRWHGTRIRTARFRDPNPFISTAMDRFNAGYANFNEAPVNIVASPSEF